MSIFDSVKGMGSDEIKKMVARECGDHPLVGHAVDMVNSKEMGGVEGLMQRFRANGLGEKVESWIGPGGKHPITAQEVERVLGKDRINEIASKFGMSADEASSKLAKVLPTVVSKMAGGGSKAASTAAA